MKRTILLLTILALFAGLSASAQFSLVRSLGVEAGLCIANQNWADDPNNTDGTLTDPRTGVNVLIQFEGIKMPYLSLIAEVGYIEKGCVLKVENTSFENPDGDGTYTGHKNRFEYFTASPIVKIRKEFVNIAPYIFIGPRLDVQLGYTSSFDWSIRKEHFDKTVFGLNYGAGVEFKFSKLGLSLSARHHPDFGNMFSTVYTSSGAEYDMEIKNKALLLNAGLKYFFD